MSHDLSAGRSAETHLRGRRAVRGAGEDDRGCRVAAAASSLIRVQCPQRAELEMGALHDAILNVADMHGGVHPSCPTCGAIGNALAVAMGVVRAEVDVEFAAKLGE